MQLVQSNASVYVRLCDTHRMGSIEVAANEGQTENLLFRPSYVQEGSRLERDMRLVKSGGRTYNNARWDALSENRIQAVGIWNGQQVVCMLISKKCQSISAARC